MTEDDIWSNARATLRDNRAIMKKQIKGWKLDPEPKYPTEKGVVLVKNPRGSDMSYRVLNPFLYRTVQGIQTFDELASFLKAPSNWKNFIPKSKKRVSRKSNKSC
jgi:hypothetical protein